MYFFLILEQTSEGLCLEFGLEPCLDPRLDLDLDLDLDLGLDLGLEPPRAARLLPLA